MAKIVDLQQIKPAVVLLKQGRKTIVLAGGCFDIIHIGHIKFLEEAKKLGDVLFVLLESDAKVKKLKGTNRPIFTQKERATVLSALEMIDYVVLLPPIDRDADYNHLIIQLSPNLIAVTENDPLMIKKKKQADKIGSKIAVIPYIKTFSSSRLAKIIGID